MKKGFLFAFVQLLSIISWAQVPAGYYSSASGLTGNDLKSALHDIIKGHTSVGYTGLWAAYKVIDVTSDNKIWDIYSSFAFTPGSDQCGTYDKEGDCYNREHTWPQSWFNEASTPKADLFHIYPTDGKVNGVRASYPYGVVGTATYTSTNGSKLGNCVTEGYSGIVFEPADEFKGDIARGLFYMSVRYYTEDSGWTSSAMTNKSVINDWAMKMLLKWSDEDPVSQKEIDRNNAIYSKYQHNRNPFIDNPEYAHMIWDADYVVGETYSITCATTLQHGTISAPATALAGTMVTLSATPEPGYELDSWTVYKTGDATTTVSVSNGTFVMPEYNITVTATFRQNNTIYTITCDNNTANGNISASTQTALSGTTVTLTATPDAGYGLYSWYVYKTGDAGTLVTVTNNTFTMPAFDVTVTAAFGQTGPNTFGNYVKVIGEPDDWSGEYLIVYEGGNKAFNGGLTTLDASGNNISVTISNNTIVSEPTTDAATFTIAATEGGYSIKSKSGYYIGLSRNDNSVASSTTTPFVNTISYSEGNVDIVGSAGAHLRYNSQSGQERFRYFKSASYTNQNPVQLYKRESLATITEPTYTVTFHSDENGGETKTQTVNVFEATALDANTFVKDGYVFDGWLDDTGNYYTDEATVSLRNDLNLYAQWEKIYSITCASQLTGGSISVNHDTALEDDPVTLTATPEEGYQLYRWNVTYTDATTQEVHTVDVVDNQFEMPFGNVTVSAVFVYVGATTPTEAHYELVTSASQLVDGKQYLVVNINAGKALSTTQNNNNRASADVTIDSNVIETVGDDVCQLTLNSYTNGDATTYSLYDSSNNGYLYAASSNSNYLRTQQTLDDNGKWAISVTNEGVATLTAQGSNTRNLLKYNNSNKIFACYGSGQQDIALFVKVDASNPAPTVIFADNENNADLIASNLNTKVNVVVYGRTLIKDGSWNTLCLPFSMTAQQVGTQLNADELMALATTTFNSAEGKLTLNFAAADEIVAGTPYLIKWSSDEDITDLRFNGVTITSENPTDVATADVTFAGLYSPVTLAAQDKSTLYLASNNSLCYPLSNITIGAFRAYFKLNENIVAGTTAGGEAKPLTVVLNFEDETTGITTIGSTVRAEDSSVVYDLQGRRIATPTRGLYIVNGKKVAIK